MSAFEELDSADLIVILTSNDQVWNRSMILIHQASAVQMMVYNAYFGELSLLRQGYLGSSPYVSGGGE